MSFSLVNEVPPQLEHFAPSESLSAASVYHASAPDFAKSSTTLRFTAGSLSGLLHELQTKIAIGTPQTRCREIVQSGRVSIMFEIRSSPQAGSHLTFLTSSSARVRNVPPPGVGVSIEMNHCSVARKITGLWQRQQCGYWCSTFSECNSAPRALSSSTIGSFALKTCRPSYSGNPL